MDTITSNEGFEKIQEIGKQWEKIGKSVEAAFKPYADFYTGFQKAIMPTINALENIVEQIKKNFAEGIGNLQPPESYDPEKTQLGERIHYTALYVTEFIEEIDKTPFAHLKDRLQVGMAAHLQGNYHLSVYSFFSSIDGMLTWFYCKDHDCSQYPNSKKKLNAFFEKYEFEKVIGKESVKPKFEIFFKHRNQIMHGGNYAHFDKNVSTTALLFLALVYHSLTENLNKEKIDIVKDSD